MRINRVKMFAIASVSLLCFFLTGLSWIDVYAADPAYPTKAINIVIPVGPGGLIDLSARVLAEAMEKELKQPVVVINKPGGATTVGGYAVASAKPDGYTLGLLINPTSVPEAYSYFFAAPYTSADLRPICQVNTFFVTVTVKADAPWNSLKDLIEYARKNPGMKFAHAGKSTIQYVLMTSIAKAENLKLVDVPYDGDGAQIPAVLGGHVPIGTPAYNAAKPMIDAKKLKVLAISSEKRVSIAPDIPVIGELGYKVPYYTTFISLFAPKKAPDHVVTKINEVVRKLSQDKEFINKNESMGLVLAYEDIAAFEKYLVQFKANIQAFFKEEGLVK